MKKLLLSVFALVAMLSCAADRTTAIKNFNGVLTDMEVATPGDSIVLRVNGSKENVAVATLDENKLFTIAAEVQAEQYYNLYLNGRQIASIITDTGDITVTFDPETKRFKTEGSRYNDIIRAFSEKLSPMVSALYSATSEAEAEQTYQDMLQTIDNSIVENCQNPTALYMLEEYLRFGGDDARAAELFELIDKKFEYLASYQAIKRTSVGSDIIDLTLKNTEGVDVTLSDITKSGKWVLVDFWATWCGPCRGEIPYLVEAYAKYADKGFEIYGVSFDRSGNEEGWKQFIQENNMTWINVWGTGSNGDWAAGEAYNVSSIPSNFLFSPEGKLVAKNLRGENVDLILGEYIK